MTRIERQCLPEATMEQIMADLPRLCDKGCKNDSKGLPSYWIGYKLHLDVADGQVPVSCVLSSASLHDSQAAIPLARLTSARLTSLLRPDGLRIRFAIHPPVQRAAWTCSHH